jgi:WD40 repeat protein
MKRSVAIELSNPFPGLRPFREDEEQLFFGRESQVDTVVDKLASTRFLAVVGTSGSGKSSLVNCGLRPALHRGLMGRAGTSWRIAQFRPGSNPLRAMALALAKHGVLFEDFVSESLTLEDIVGAALGMSKLGLADVYEQAQLDKNVNLLVIVDQFEELFRYRMLEASPIGGADRTQEATAFVNLLLEPKTQASLPIYVVLTMRSDFLGDCAEFPGLPEAINEGQYLVPRMTREERRAAIAGPAGVGGADISPVLLTRLVNDVGDNPDQLSILQHALNRTWARWQHEGCGEGPLDLPHYEAIGTMAHALDQHAEKAYEELENERQKKICEKIFKALTDKGTDARGIRRPTKLTTLCALAGASQTEVTSVIDIFRKPSRSFLMPPLSETLEQETIIDISHESLMRVWERLKAWANDEAQWAQLYRRLSETAALHEAGRASLYSGPDLALALEWRKKENPTEVWAGLHRGGFSQAMGFLAESEAQRDKDLQDREERQRRDLEQAKALALAKEQARAARRLRRWAAAVTVCALIASLAAVYAKRQESLANKQAFIAQKANEKAKEQTEKANEQTEKAKKQKAIAERLQAAAEKESKADSEKKHIADSLRLAQGATVSIGEEKDIDPERGVLLALESAEATYPADKILTPEAENALRRTVQAFRVQGILETPRGTPQAVAFSADGSRLSTWIAGSRDIPGEATLQDPSGKEVAPRLTLPVGVTRLAFDPNVRYVATSGGVEDATVRLWNLDNRAEVRDSPLKHQGAVRAFTFSPDGKYVATASQDKFARLWDASNGSLVREILHSDVVTAVAFTPDGHSLATASDDKIVRLWDITEGSKISEMLHLGRVSALALGPNGMLATISHGDASGDAVTLWDDLSGKQLWKVAGEGTSAISFSPDGRLLATVRSNGIARIFDVISGRWLRQYLGNTEVKWLTFSADGQKLATAGSDNIARVWSTSGGAELFRLLGHKASIISLAFSPSGGRLATASVDRTMMTWSARSGITPMELTGHAGPINRIAFSPDGGRLVTASWDRTAKVWNAQTGKELLTLYGHTKEVLGVAFSPDGRRIVTGSADNTAKVWDAHSGKELFTLLGHGDRVMAVAFSPDGKKVATASRDRTARLWDANKGEALTILKGHTGSVEDVAFSPDGRWLATASTDTTAKVWDLAAPGKDWCTLRGHQYWVTGVAFSPDGKRLATASWDRTARIWRIDSGTEKEIGRQLTGHRGPVQNVAFSRDGRYLATASEDNTAKVWDAASGAELLTMLGHTDKVYGVTFSPDGFRLATAAADDKALVYAWGGKELVRFAKTRVSRDLTALECKTYTVESKPCKRVLQAEVLVAQGRDEARDTKLAVAIATFVKAKKLDDSLKLDPEAEAKRLAAETLVAKGEELANNDDINGAIAALGKALELDRDINHRAAAILFQKGVKVAKSGDLNGAISIFRNADEFDPGLNLDSEKEARKYVAEGLTTNGRSLAKSGDLNGAISIFRNANEFDPGLNLDPEKEARKYVAEGLTTKGRSLAKSGDVEGATVAFRRALEFEPGRKLNPEAEANRPKAEGLIANGSKYMEQDKIKDAVTAFADAASIYGSVQGMDPDGSARASTWNALCWEASLRGHAADVMDACERAVEQAEQLKPLSWNTRDSRGVARALTGNTDGAIEDFQFFIEHATNAERKAERQKWVSLLRAGQKPFTHEVMELLLDQ